LTWEEEKPVTGEAHVRAEVEMRGDEVGSYRPFLKVPEEWVRELNKPRIQDFIPYVGFVLIALWVLIAGIRRLSEHTFRWRLYVTLASLAAALSLTTLLNGLSTFGSQYDTSTPWRAYVFLQSAGYVLGFMVIGFLALLLALAADVFYAAGVP